MQTPQNLLNITVIWRGKKFLVELNSNATLKDLGNELRKLADVKEDTMRFIVPQHSGKSSKLLSPFSKDHSSLSLVEASILGENSIRMMGVSKDEFDEVMQYSKVDLRIAGFDEDEKRFRQRTLGRSVASVKLPQGTYIFCDFRSLAIPGIMLNPPPSEALRRMHMLASDPGIVAIMNKHRWRVGIMTEMAPEGYVGVSPKCLLGFNKNHGEEISLRLRTDDLKGFRKYESIKKTLLHELAHMVYSEHDASFYALDKQLNQEAASLDWTKSRSHTLSSVRYSEHYEEELGVGDSSNYSHKVGGSTSDQLGSARASSVAAAYCRLTSASVNSLGVCEVHEELDTDDSGFPMYEGPGSISSLGKEEPDPNNSQDSGIMEIEQLSEINERPFFEPVGDDSEITQFVPPLRTEGELGSIDTFKEPDSNDLETCKIVAEPDPCQSEAMEITGNAIRQRLTIDELDPDQSEAVNRSFGYRNVSRPDNTDSLIAAPMEDLLYDNNKESDLDDNLKHPPGSSEMQVMDLNFGDEELQRIQDPVTVFYSRLQKAIEMLRSEFPTEAITVLQTLFKLIRNLIDHPNEMRFKKVRKANPTFQRNVANYKAAMEILFLIGFNEDTMMDEIGKAETYLVLKRNDPGLLWLAKSSLEICISC